MVKATTPKAVQRAAFESRKVFVIASIKMF
jgi:hypothetical protein